MRPFPIVAGASCSRTPYQRAIAIRKLRMSQPLIVTIPHRLGREEAVRRLKSGLATARANYSALPSGVHPPTPPPVFSLPPCRFSAPNRDLTARHKSLPGPQRTPPFCALSRLRLHEILLGAAQRAGVEVRCGLTASEIHQDDD